VEPVSKDRKTCLDCLHGFIDGDGEVRCFLHDREVVQWFSTPKQCLDYKDQA
jgi:hypothetical protein